MFYRQLSSLENEPFTAYLIFEYFDTFHFSIFLNLMHAFFYASCFKTAQKNVYTKYSRVT